MGARSAGGKGVAGSAEAEGMGRVVKCVVMPAGGGRCVSVGERGQWAQGWEWEQEAQKEKRGMHWDGVGNTERESNVLGSTELAYTNAAVANKTSRARQCLCVRNKGRTQIGHAQMLPPSNMRFPASPSRRLQRIVVPPSTATAAMPYASTGGIVARMA